MATASSSSDNLLDKLQFNDGGGDFHFIFYNKGVIFILHTHKIKQEVLMKESLLPPPISKHPERSYSIEQKNQDMFDFKISIKKQSM